jgi:hypothetical protein
MCDDSAVTKEHVPPKCFFPDSLRDNLVTVPACTKHNLENSRDVEYVRNVISTQHGTNDAAAEIFETTKRSLDHSPKLMSRTFGNIRTVTVGGDETGAFPVDLVRHKNVMSAIAYAIYFQNKRRKHRGHWLIFTPSFGYAPSVLGGQPDPWQSLRQYLDSGQYTPIPVAHPEVFKCELIDMEQDQSMYRFTFYGRVVVNAITQFETLVNW